MLLKGATLVRLHPPALANAPTCASTATPSSRAARGCAPKPGEAVEDCRGRLILPGLRVRAHAHVLGARRAACPARRPRRSRSPTCWRGSGGRSTRRSTTRPIYYSRHGRRRRGRPGRHHDHRRPPRLAQRHPGLARHHPRGLRRGRRARRALLRGDGPRRAAPPRRRASPRTIGSCRRRATDPQFRGLVGAHASFTLRDASLAAARRPRRATTASGIHIHVAEARDDVERTRRAHGCGIVDRLERHGLLNDRAVLAHGVHLTARELARVASARRVARAQPAVEHEQRRRARAHRALRRPRGARHGRVAGRHARRSCASRTSGSGSASGCAGRSRRRRCSRAGSGWRRSLFGVPFGTLAPGVGRGPRGLRLRAADAADGGATWPAHLLGGRAAGDVHGVMAAGRWVCRNGVPVNIDVDAVYCRARQLAAALWRRMRG